MRVGTALLITLVIAFVLVPAGLWVLYVALCFTALALGSALH